MILISIVSTTHEVENQTKNQIAKYCKYKHTFMIISQNCTSNHLLTLACQRVGARTTETSLRGTSYKAPVERGEELARLLVWAP